MTTWWPMLRAWLGYLHPRRRLAAETVRQPSPKDTALEKRAMERRLQDRGMSRAEARRVTVAHFADPARKEAEGGDAW